MERTYKFLDQEARTFLLSGEGANHCATQDIITHSGTTYQILTLCLYVHPSSSTCPIQSWRVCWNLSQLSQLVRGRLHPGQVVSLSLGEHTETGNLSNSHLLLQPTQNLQLTYPNVRPLVCERKLKYSERTCTDSTQKGLSLDLNPGTSCCEVTVSGTLCLCSSV